MIKKIREELNTLTTINELYKIQNKRKVERIELNKIDYDRYYLFCKKKNLIIGKQIDLLV